MDLPVDSGMDGDLVEVAKSLWATLPAVKPWDKLETHEIAMVCAMVGTHRRLVQREIGDWLIEKGYRQIGDGVINFDLH